MAGAVLKKGASKLRQMLPASFRRAAKLSFLDLPPQIRQMVYEYFFYDISVQLISAPPASIDFRCRIAGVGVNISRRLSNEPNYNNTYLHTFRRWLLRALTPGAMQRRRSQKEELEANSIAHAHKCLLVLLISKKLQVEIRQAMLQSAKFLVATRAEMDLLCQG